VRLDRAVRACDSVAAAERPPGSAGHRNGGAGETDRGVARAADSDRHHTAVRDFRSRERLGRLLWRRRCNAATRTHGPIAPSRPDRRQRGNRRREELNAMPTIDFAEVRARIPIQQVLQLVQFQPVRRSGAELRGPCPIHGARSARSRCFAANLHKNVFRCFHCGRGGNALDLYAAVRHINVYHAALELCQRLGIELPQKRAGE